MITLRRWRDSDRAPFAAMNADPRVMQFMPSLLTPAESDAFIGRVEAHFDQHGFGLYAVEVEDAFIGYTGLMVPSFTAHFTPCVEIGWRIASSHWNRGIATHAARTVLAEAFGPLGLKEIVSFTVPDNRASRRVMEKIGMTHNPVDDFDHPRLPEGHPLRRHVLYRAFR